MKKLLASLFLGTVMLSGCNPEQAEIQKAEDIEGSEVLERVRPAPSGGTSAAYFTYKNELSEADTLLSVSSNVSGMAQVHESYEAEGGMMGMREQEQIILQPGDSVQFQQGGLHIMLMSLSKDLVAGDSTEIQLEFARAGTIKKTIVVSQ
jgi:copper(I)-binding protein